MSASVHARHAERIHAAVDSSLAAKSALVASWRCSAALHKLDPSSAKAPSRLTTAELARNRERMEPLIHAAQGTLDRLYQAIGGSGCCILLADKDGVPVERRGAIGDDVTFDKWGLWTGAVWSEESEGTNGIGTCLVEGRPLTIHREQHFYSKNTLLSCTSAPIYDHEGNLTAALDVSSCRSDLTEGFVHLMAVALGDAVARIEAENFRRAFPDARVMIAPTQDNSPAALLAINKNDLVIGATRAARLAFNLTSDALLRPLPAADLIGGDADRTTDFREAERAVLERTLIRTDGNVTEAARVLGLSRATLYRKLAKFGGRGVH